MALLCTSGWRFLGAGTTEVRNITASTATCTIAYGRSPARSRSWWFPPWSSSGKRRWRRTPRSGRCIGSGRRTMTSGTGGTRRWRLSRSARRRGKRRRDTRSSQGGRRSRYAPPSFTGRTEGGRLRTAQEGVRVGRCFSVLGSRVIPPALTSQGSRGRGVGGGGVGLWGGLEGGVAAALRAIGRDTRAGHGLDGRR